MPDITSNPLLNFDSLPHFDRIKAEHVVPALEWVLQDARQQIAELCKVPAPTWQNFALIMENLDERISRVWSPVGHLNGVQDSPELRDAYQSGIALLTEYHSEVGQNKVLFNQYTKLKSTKQSNKQSNTELSKAQQKIIDNALLDFKLSGAELEQNEQTRLTDINQQLSQLNTQFERNLLDSTQSWSLLVTDKEQLTGLPDSALAMAKQAAKADQQDGWLFTLQIPSYLAVMQHAQNSNLRRDVYQVYAKRASELVNDGQHDNAPIIDQTLALRQEQAKLLGYTDYAAYSLVKKMASSSTEVLDFLSELAQHAKPIAEQELAELRHFAQETHGVKELQPWDISYYSERLREHRYDFNDEQVKPYFPANKVFDGLFEIVNRLFLINIIENTNMPTWHSDVRCFDLINADSQAVIGSLYTDLYVRKGKRGGAWMDTCINRRVVDGQLQKPVAFLTCNFSPPIASDPALLSHDEVETLFHEFGHTLHHLLTQVDELSVSGINGVAWDAVELPSQFLENWCWQEQSLKLIAEHYKTGESLPSELLEKMRAAKNFQSAMQTLRQVEFAMFDMRLHSQNHNASVQTVLDQVRDEVALIKPPSYNRFQNSFGHIFAGGYAAGYYSYKWSEVLSADAFARFEEEGIFNPKTGLSFLNSILERGGVDDPNDLFFEFRQRKPDIDALLRHTGLK